MKKEGSRVSSKSTESDIRLNMMMKVTRELHTRSSTRNNPWETRMYKGARFRSCGTGGYGPSLNKKGVDIQCDQVARHDREQLVNYVGNNIGAKGEGRREPFSCSLR